MTACTHIASIIHPCPPQNFCMRPVVGMRPTMPFDPQRDRQCRTASGMKPMYRLTVSPFSFFFFLFFRFFVFFFFPSPVRLHTLLTRIRTPSLCAPALAWPEDEAATPLQGLDDDDDDCLHPHHVHHPMSLPRFLCAADHPLRPTKRPLASNCQWYEADHPVCLPPFFLFPFFFCRMPDRMGRPGSAEMHMNVGASLTLVFFSSVSFFFFFLFGCSTYDKHKM